MPPRFLLCPPRYFAVDHAINAHMVAGTPIDLDRAHEQWNSLRRALEFAGAEVVEQRPAAGLADMVFTNNAALVVEGRAAVARFRHAERQPESAHGAAALRSLGFDVSHLPVEAGTHEGAAEVAWFAGRAICAVGPRTSRASIPFVEAFSGLAALPVTLRDARYYHLDVAFCPLDDERHALIVPGAFDELSLRRLLDLVPEPILLEDADAMQFCANAIVVDGHVLMHHVPVRIAAALQDAGLVPVEVPVGEFLKSGGSVRCMALRLDVDLAGQRALARRRFAAAVGVGTHGRSGAPAAVAAATGS